MTDKMNEKQLERKLTTEAKKKGTTALKLTSPFFTGLPDRLLLSPGGIARFAEIKTPGKKLSPRQVVVKKFLESLGFKVYIIDSEESLNQCLYEI